MIDYQRTAFGKFGIGRRTAPLVRDFFAMLANQSNRYARPDQYAERLRMWELGASLMSKLGSGGVTKNTCLLVDNCRNVDLAPVSNAKLIRI
jgi:hypothetical protein